MIELFHPKHQELVFALLDAKVDFLVIGGYAVIYHGYVRTTNDLDVWLKPTNENKLKVLEVVSKMGIEDEDIKQLETLDFTKIVVFHLGNEPERTDFLTKMMGIDFDEAFKQRSILEANGYSIPFLSLNDLIINKIISNRPKDKGDLDELQKLNKLN